MLRSGPSVPRICSTAGGNLCGHEASRAARRAAHHDGARARERGAEEEEEREQRRKERETGKGRAEEEEAGRAEEARGKVKEASRQGAVTLAARHELRAAEAPARVVGKREARSLCAWGHDARGHGAGSSSSTRCARFIAPQPGGGRRDIAHPRAAAATPAPGRWALAYRFSFPNKSVIHRLNTEESGFRSLSSSGQVCRKGDPPDQVRRTEDI